MEIIVSLSGVIVSIVALVVSYFLISTQNKLSLKQYTLNYIDMENNDELLIQSRKWLLDINNTIEYIDSLCSSKSFLKYKKIDDSQFKEGSFPVNRRDLVDEFIAGNTYINKIISARIIASEAIISNLIDEETYWLARHIDFFNDYRKLKSFILKKYEQENHNDGYSRKPFRRIINRWEETNIINVKKKMKTRKWKKYQLDIK